MTGAARLAVEHSSTLSTPLSASDILLTSLLTIELACEALCAWPLPRPSTISISTALTMSARWPSPTRLAASTDAAPFATAAVDNVEDGDDDDDDVVVVVDRRVNCEGKPVVC